jgi:hypothetical protein
MIFENFQTIQPLFAELMKQSTTKVQKSFNDFGGNIKQSVTRGANSLQNKLNTQNHNANDEKMEEIYDN